MWWGTIEWDEDDYVVMVYNEDHEADDLKCPSSEELLSAMSSNDEVECWFSKFTTKMDMQDSYFKVE